jgi:hypothetical protein
MNACRLLVLSGLLAASLAHAQKPQISVSARQKLEGDTEQNSTKYTNTKEKDRTCELTIQLRNGDPKEQKVKLTWYFVGDPLVGGFDDFVYDKGELEMTLPARFATNLVQKSKPIESKVATGRKKVTKSGAKHAGFIVMVSQETNLLAVATAPTSLDKTARNAEAMAKLLLVPTPP